MPATMIVSRHGSVAAAAARSLAWSGVPSGVLAVFSAAAGGETPSCEATGEAMRARPAIAATAAMI